MVMGERIKRAQQLPPVARHGTVTAALPGSAGGVGLVSHSGATDISAVGDVSPSVGAPAIPAVPQQANSPDQRRNVDISHPLTPQADNKHDTDLATSVGHKHYQTDDLGHPETARPATDDGLVAAGPAEYPNQPAPAPILDRATVIARQKEQFGGIKVGSAFFGWLTATGMSVLMIALLAAAGVAFGVATNSEVSVDQALLESDQASGTAQTVGLVGAIILLVVLLLAYYCGGYVAGRMARFNGVRQGLAVWLWGVLMALVVAAIAATAGAQYDVLAQLNLLRLPVNEGQVTVVGAITIGAAILAALVGALLGGLAGMRFHRNVDKTGLEPVDQ